MGAVIGLDETFDHHRRMLARIAGVQIILVDEFIVGLEITLSHGVTLEWLRGLCAVVSTSFGPKLYRVTQTRSLGDAESAWFVMLARQSHLSLRDPRTPSTGYITFLSGDLRREVPIVS